MARFYPEAQTAPTHQASLIEVVALDMEELVQLYQAGWTLGRLARRYAVTPPAIWQRLQRRGLVHKRPVKE